MDGFVQAPVGPVPRVRTRLLAGDWIGTTKTRLGFGRYNYKVVPGLYAVGDPGSESPVLVTANYKLSFDALRRELTGIDAWLLVVDTRGINVWCAAGKNLFCTEEVVRSIRESRLHSTVSHRELVLPQLSATGVAAHVVKRESGFKVNYGPVRAEDLPLYLVGGDADEQMRAVTFPWKQRAVLIPVELFLLAKPLLITIAAVLVLSGIGPALYSFSQVFARGMSAVVATILGILAGAALVPLLLPLLPWRQFWPKGLLTGAGAGLLVVVLFHQQLSVLGWMALFLWTCAVSSYLAMNFTGSTPYTSPSGVEKEMRLGIPVQMAAAALALILWLAAPFAA